MTLIVSFLYFKTFSAKINMDILGLFPSRKRLLCFLWFQSRRSLFFRSVLINSQRIPLIVPFYFLLMVYLQSIGGLYSVKSHRFTSTGLILLAGKNTSTPEISMIVDFGLIFPNLAQIFHITFNLLLYMMLFVITGLWEIR